MFLISKFVYEAMEKSRLHETAPYLKIENRLRENHLQTFYRFRFGAVDDGGKVGSPSPLTLKRNSYANIWSLEAFKFSERVVGIFGHPSSLFKRGLELVHSPFIEPTFEGHLQLIIKNFSNQELVVNHGEIIGKIVFFDISDTIISAEDLLNEVQEDTHNQIRKKAMEAFTKAMYET